MRVEVLLSTMNLNLEDLDSMNITTPCIVINQCGKNGYREYKNFKIYDSNSIGIGKSRNMAISKSKADILLFCDNDCVYNKDYEKTILDFYGKQKDADMVFFNMDSYDNSIRNNTKGKRIHWYNYQKYAAYRISFKRTTFLKENIKVNEMFGGNAKYSHGEDTILIHEFLKRKCSIYASNHYIGQIVKNSYESTWFHGYTDKFYFDKGALFGAISKYPHFQCIQYVIRHRVSFNKLKIMFQGIHSYQDKISYEEFIKKM